MSEIDEHICELLYDHDCVIVPELGGFLASYKGASIHPVQHSISPPARRVAFNVFLKQNDGLLANRLSSSEHSTYLEAVRKIESYSAACRRELMAGKKIAIDGVGLLFNDKEGNLQFEPLPSANFLRDSFGLNPVQHLPVVRESLRQREEKQLKEFITIRPSVKKDPKKTGAFRKSKKVLSRIVVGSAILWLGVNVFLVLKSNKDVLAFFNGVKPNTEEAKTSNPIVASNPPSSEASVQPAVNMETTAAVISIPETTTIEQRAEVAKPDDAPLAVNQQKNFSEKEIQSPAVQELEKKIIPESNLSSENKKYFIIAGAFSIPENASSLVEQLHKSGFPNAHIVPSRHKLTLVCYDGFSTRRDANQVLDTIQNSKRDGWVFAN